MIKDNPFNPITPKPNNKYNPFNPISVQDQPLPIYTPQPIEQRPGPRVAQPTQTRAPIIGKDGTPLPQSTLSQGSFKESEEPSLWNKVARTLLPKKAEDYFGLNDTPIQKDIKRAKNF